TTGQVLCRRDRARERRRDRASNKARHSSDSVDEAQDDVLADLDEHRRGGVDAKQALHGINERLEGGDDHCAEAPQAGDEAAPDFLSLALGLFLPPLDLVDALIEAIERLRELVNPLDQRHDAGHPSSVLDELAELAELLDTLFFPKACTTESREE